MGSPPAFDRAAALRRLADEPFDVLVVGGGITGAGCALDAASRGLRTALVERDDFASGTSSKSLEARARRASATSSSARSALVYENLGSASSRSRTRPHLVRVLPFLIPIFTRDGLIDRRIARALGAAMWMYDLTGGLRIGKRHKRISTRRGAPPHADAAARQRRRRVHLLRRRADDARLTLAIARTAAAHGAVVANYARVVGLLKDRDGSVARCPRSRPTVRRSTYEPASS